MDRLLESGIPYEFQGNSYEAYPVIMRNDLTQVTMHSTPIDITALEIEEMMEPYGKCIQSKIGYDIDNIADGQRKLEMILKRHVPKKLNIPYHMGGGEVKLSYASKPVINGKYCYICQSEEHTAIECPLQIPCEYCKGEGKPHLTRYCKKREKQNILQRSQEVVHEVLQEMAKQQITAKETPHSQNKENSLATSDANETNALSQIVESELQMLTDIANLSEQDTSEMEEQTQSHINNNMQRLFILGDSQVNKLREVKGHEEIEMVHIPGGRFNDGKKYLQKCETKFENLALYFGTNQLSQKNQTVENQVQATLDISLQKAHNIYCMANVPYKGRLHGPNGVYKVNKTIKEQAEKRGIKFVGIPEQFLKADTDKLYELDNVHLSEEGAEIVLKHLLDDIQAHQIIAKKRKCDLSPQIDSSQKIAKKTEYFNEE